MSDNEFPISDYPTSSILRDKSYDISNRFECSHEALRGTALELGP